MKRKKGSRKIPEAVKKAIKVISIIVIKIQYTGESKEYSGWTQHKKSTLVGHSIK